MKKIDNKGFMLTETLIVATFLVTTLLFLYIQFNNVTKTYDTSFKYNTVNGLYAVNNIINYVKSDGIDTLKTSINNVDYIDITDCSDVYFTEQNYCNTLMDTLKIKTVLFTKENLSSLKSSRTTLDQTMIDFIKFINYEEVTGYRIIIEFNDSTFASLKIKE